MISKHIEEAAQLLTLLLILLFCPSIQCWDFLILLVFKQYSHFLAKSHFGRVYKYERQDKRQVWICTLIQRVCIRKTWAWEYKEENKEYRVVHRLTSWVCNFGSSVLLFITQKRITGLNSWGTDASLDTNYIFRQCAASIYNNVG